MAHLPLPSGSIEPWSVLEAAIAASHLLVVDDVEHGRFSTQQSQRLTFSLFDDAKHYQPPFNDLTAPSAVSQATRDFRFPLIYGVHLNPNLHAKLRGLR